MLPPSLGLKNKLNKKKGIKQVASRALIYIVIFSSHFKGAVLICSANVWPVA
jgi:hypothetical protein